jgi:hypothetical protein
MAYSSPSGHQLPSRSLEPVQEYRTSGQRANQRDRNTMGQRGDGEDRNSYGYGGQRTEMRTHGERPYSRETNIPALQGLSFSDNHGLTRTSAHGYIGNARLDHDNNNSEARARRSNDDRPTDSEQALPVNGRDCSDSHGHYMSRKYICTL